MKIYTGDLENFRNVITDEEFRVIEDNKVNIRESEVSAEVRSIEAIRVIQNIMNRLVVQERNLDSALECFSYIVGSNIEVCVNADEQVLAIFGKEDIVLIGAAIASILLPIFQSDMLVQTNFQNVRRSEEAKTLLEYKPHTHTIIILPTVSEFMRGVTEDVSPGSRDRLPQATEEILIAARTQRSISPQRRTSSTSSSQESGEVVDIPREDVSLEEAGYRRQVIEDTLAVVRTQRADTSPRSIRRRVAGALAEPRGSLSREENVRGAEDADRTQGTDTPSRGALRDVGGTVFSRSNSGGPSSSQGMGGR